MNTNKTIQCLPETLSKNGNEYRLFRRGERALIYAEGPNDQNLGFEVFKIKIALACVFNGYNYPDRERFPGNEDFGSWAWSYVGVSRLERAMIRFNQLEGIDVDSNSASTTSIEGIKNDKQPLVMVDAT